MMTIIMRPKNQTFREGGRAGGRSPPEFFGEFRVDFENCLCNFIEFSILQIFGGEVWRGEAPREKFCEFRGVFEDFCIRYLIM